ncbi:hypothetical protein TNCV_1405671 [Trichonephila clavipes]|nr:hypothetical protein TNCV_1405671 [Trichonephila clavipes]
MILRPTPQTDDGGMRGGAGTVDLGDGCAVMILLTYSQTDDGGMRRGPAVDITAERFFGPTSKTDDGGMRRGRTVDLVDGGAVMIHSDPTPKVDDKMREAGAVDLGDGCAVTILWPAPQTDDGGMREGPELLILGDGAAAKDSPALRRKRDGAVDFGDGAAVKILRPYAKTDDGGMRDAGAVDLGDGAAAADSPNLRQKRMMEE